VAGERSGITCAGSVVIDLTKAVPDYPAPNRMTIIERVVANTGGPGMNMAVDLRMLRAPFPVALVGTIGDDQNGALVRSECRRLGIDDSGILTLDGVATSFTDVLVEPGGRRTMFHHPGSSDRLTPDLIDVDGCRSRILHLGSPGIHAGMDAPAGAGDGEGAGNGWTRVLARARAAGLHTNMELVDLPAERMVELVGPCLPHLDSIVINELEAGTLTGIDVTAPEADGDVDWESLEAMARGLIEAGVARLAVVHFPAGCTAADADGRVWRQGSVRLPPEEFRSAVGAGDAFAAGILLGLHEGWEVERCLRLAVASAAASARDLTTSAGIEAAEACLALGERLGHRPTG
jgi:sugar/nucleoside kinase (ribokinase family)